MKKLFTLLLSSMMVVAASATDITAVSAGDWSNSATWSSGTIPGAGDNVITNNLLITVDVDATCDNLILGVSPSTAASATTIKINAGVVLTVRGKIDAFVSSNVDVFSASDANSKLKLTGELAGDSLVGHWAMSSVRPKILEVAVSSNTLKFIGSSTVAASNKTLNVSGGKLIVKSPTNLKIGPRIQLGRADDTNVFTIDAGAIVETRVIEGEFIGGYKYAGAKIIINGTLKATDRMSARVIELGSTGMLKTASGSSTANGQAVWDSWWNSGSPTAVSNPPGFGDFATPISLTFATGSTLEFYSTGAQNVLGIVPENKVYFNRVGATGAYTYMFYDAALPTVGSVAGTTYNAYTIPYNNILISGGGTKTIQSNLVATGNVTVDAGTLILPAGKVMVVGGTVGGGGTFTNSGALITLTSADVTKGTVTATVNAANLVTLVATPKAGYQLGNYTEGGSALASGTFTAVDGAPRTIVANFVAANGLDNNKVAANVTVIGRNLKLNGDVKAIEVYNAQGKRVMSKQNVTNVNLSANGIYIVKLHTAQGVVTQKVNIN